MPFPARWPDWLEDMSRMELCEYIIDGTDKLYRDVYDLPLETLRETVWQLEEE